MTWEQLGPYRLAQQEDLPKVSRDSLLLAEFATLRRGDRVFDLGCGVGVLGLSLARRETGLTLEPVDAGPYSRPCFTTAGMTDESCCTVFGYCSGTPTNRNQESSEDIQVILADRAECRRILREENVAIMCAYMLMHFVASEQDPLMFLKA